MCAFYVFLFRHTKAAFAAVVCQAPSSSCGLLKIFHELCPFFICVKENTYTKPSYEEKIKKPSNMGGGVLTEIGLRLLTLCLWEQQQAPVRLGSDLKVVWLTWQLGTYIPQAVRIANKEELVQLDLPFLFVLSYSIFKRTLLDSGIWGSSLRSCYDLEQVSWPLGSQVLEWIMKGLD